MGLELSQILTQIFAFLIMLWVLKKYGWKPLLETLDERKRKIKSDFDSIAAQQEEVRKLTAKYEQKLKEIDAEGRYKIQEAVLAARRISSEIHNDAQANAKEMIVKAKAEIHREIEGAKTQLKNDLVNIVIATTEKILKEKLDKPKHEKLILDFVEEAGLK